MFQKFQNNFKKKLKNCQQNLIFCTKKKLYARKTYPPQLLYINTQNVIKHIFSNINKSDILFIISNTYTTYLHINTEHMINLCKQL